MTSPPKNALITGAASGLGRAFALRLASLGWQVVLADLDTAGLEETRRLILQEQRIGQEATTRLESLDVRDAEQWKALCRKLRADWQQLDLLVNNAGVAGAGYVGEFSLENWDWILRTNLHGSIHGCHTMLPWMKENPCGAHLIQTASLAGVWGMPGMAAYNVSKAGVLALAETLYAELKPYNVGVTVLCPSFFQTSLLANGRIDTNEQRLAAERISRNAPYSADDVVRLALRAMQKKKLYVMLPRRARWMWRLKRWSPGFYARLLAYLYHRGWLTRS